MAKFLKLAEFSKNDRMAKMNIRTRWIDTEFYAKGSAKRESFAQLNLTDDLRRARLEQYERFIRLHIHYGIAHRPGALFIFIQQLTHLLDGHGRVLPVERLLTFTSIKERAFAGKSAATVGLSSLFGGIANSARGRSRNALV